MAAPDQPSPVVGPPLERQASDAAAPGGRARCSLVLPLAAATGIDLAEAVPAATAAVLSRYYGERAVALPVVPGPAGIAVVVDPEASWADLLDGVAECDPPARSAVAVSVGATGSAEVPGYALVLSVDAETGGLVLQADFDAASVDPDMAARLLAHVGVVVRAMADDPHAPTGATGLLTPEEHRLIVEEWNETDVELPADPFPLLFERHAAAAPEAVAVVDQGNVVTYGELNHRANRLARHLRAQGVTPGALIGICLSRSPEFMVSALAAMKAGAVYVPLDSLLYPADRIAFMIEDTGIGLIVTEEALVPMLPPDAAPVVLVDGDAYVIAGQAGDNLGVALTLDDPVYAIFTSGSTGVPKCVVVPYRGLAMLVAATPIVGVGPHSRVLQFAPCSFDISVGDMALAFSVGASLHIATIDALLSSDALLRQLEEERITNIQVSPSVLANVPVADLPELETIICGAEPCPADLVARWGAAHRLLNAYGPTETTVAATFKECTDPLSTPPIGRPIPHARVYVLDGAGHPAPIGVTGEIFIGGAGVALRYHNRPELTAERFVLDPFRQGGGRMYRTGDLGRWRPDGDLEFLGRIDEQVKILGHRIELGEVESVLSTHASVRDCVVTAVGEGSARRLVGYVVSHGEPATTTALRAHLRTRLPEFMVPAVFVSLDALPLTPNGKVDKAALPAPGSARPDLDHDYVAPQDERETVLAAIWADVLGLDLVGATDNFFELGGDSILAIQAVSAANRAGLRLQARQLHQHPTVAELARVAGTAEAIVAEQGAVVGPVPLTPIQRWFFAQGSPDPANYAFSVLFDLPVDLPAAALQAALDGLVRHHDALRMRFTRVDGEWRQENLGLGPWDLAFEEAALHGPRGLDRDARRRQACAAARARLRLDRGPLVAATLLRTPPGEPDQLYLAVHHLVLDGISWRILLDDLATAAEQVLAGVDVVLPGKTSSFKHWAERLDDLARSGSLEAEAARWLDPPAEARAALRRDRPGGVNLVADEERVTVAVSEEVTSRLLIAAPAAWRAGVTDLLLAAVVDAVCRWSGRSALAVDVETHGREDLWADTDLSRTVGWFTAMCPIDVVGAGRDLAGCVQAVKDALRGQVDRAVEYGLLRWSPGPVGERLAAQPTPAVGFNYLGQFDTGLAGVTVAEGPGELAGLSQDPGARRPHDIEVTGYVLGGRLHLDWAYCRALHDRASVESMAADACARLADIARADASVTRRAVAPEDFPLAGLDRRGLATVLSVVDSAPPFDEGTLT